ncbi:hypothetical protein [Nocardioides sp. SYSU D00065]|uniref:hypothetical protein n=1 Tax=Nocardioides sp. SYSU D00065 TaxID=2817378 RepID=UPI001B326B0D|nr:hypothetical protein [Nocardioides sp. SYSU D00065]
MTSLPTPRGRRRAATLAGGLALTSVLVAALSACASDGGDDTASDPAASSTAPSPSESASDAPSGTDEPTPEPESGDGSQTIPATGSAGVAEALLISATDAGGSASTFAFALDGDQAVSDFVTGLDAGFADTVRATVAEVAQQAPGSTPYGATVSVGCEAPTGVAVEQGEAGFQVVAQLPKSTVQCLAPMTFVVVFAAPDA